MLEAYLFEAPPHDPFVLGAACGLLAVVAFVAAFAPGRFAANIDPAHTLRAE